MEQAGCLQPMPIYFCMIHNHSITTPQSPYTHYCTSSNTKNNEDSIKHMKCIKQQAIQIHQHTEFYLHEAKTPACLCCCLESRQKTPRQIHLETGSTTRNPVSCYGTGSSLQHSQLSWTPCVTNRTPQHLETLAVEWTGPAQWEGKKKHWLGYYATLAAANS